MYVKGDSVVIHARTLIAFKHSYDVSLFINSDFICKEICMYYSSIKFVLHVEHEERYHRAYLKQCNSPAVIYKDVKRMDEEKDHR